MEGHRPTIAMVLLQFTNAAVNLTARAALTQGMRPWVLVVYRQAIATIFMAPIAYFAERCKERKILWYYIILSYGVSVRCKERKIWWYSIILSYGVSVRRKPTAAALGIKSLSLMFITSLIGITVKQSCYFMGMSLTSSTIASVMSNLLPVVTFVMAASLGLEKVNIRSLASIAKVIGTIVCVMGALSMALIKGPKLLNIEFSTSSSIFQSEGENWILGCALLFGSCCCWSVWLILQVPMSESYPNHLSLSAWTCFFAMIQSGTVAIFLEPDPIAWELNSSIKIVCCIYTGIIGSGMSFYVQSWCISKGGPLFSAMFSPLCIVIVTISASIFLHEELYIGSLVGAIAVIGGLYVVLWGKTHDLNARREISPSDGSVQINASSDESMDGCKIEIKEPLLGDKLQAIDRDETTH